MLQRITVALCVTLCVVGVIVGLVGVSSDPEPKQEIVRARALPILEEHKADLVALNDKLDPEPTRKRNPRPDPKPEHEHVVVYSAAVGGVALCDESCIQCESGGNPMAWNPAGYWGLYQFDFQTWVAHGGDPDLYGKAGSAEQHAVASRITYDAWPNC